MKSLKKIFTLFALFAMVACLSISSFALEPDEYLTEEGQDGMEEVPSEPDMAMSEADMEADTILEKAIPEISPEAGIVDPVEPADIYPACDHNYITSPVGSPREVYDSSSGMFGHAQDYIHRCTKCGEYYYTTEYTWHS